VPGGLERARAYALAAAVVFLIANAFPIMSLSGQGTRTSATLLGAVQALRAQDLGSVAALVLVTAFLMPAIKITTSLYLLLGSGRRRRPPGLGVAFRLWRLSRPWTMIDVLVLAILATVGRLGKIALLEVGLALWSFAALMVLLAATDAAFDPRAFWRRAWDGDVPGTEPATPVAGLLACEACGLLDRPGPGARACARCGAALHARKPHSLSRTLALLLAAYILYLPANLLPILHSGSLFGSQRDTIMSGVVYLWVTGSWPLALLIFVASITVPLAKLLSLTLLLVSVRWRWRWAPLQRARLYRVVARIGRWSMLDIFVSALLAALVQLRPFATIRVGPAAAAFGAVVVLTMIAAQTFDPRLIWDATAERRA
jgi:paraquat-inducible protein A